VLPRVRAARAHHPLFRIGTARGTCDQEGYALCLEERSGWLDASRKRELAIRHRVAERMRDGADFADAVEFAREHGEPLDAALRFAERAHRGGDGATAGLGREIVYLASYIRVRDRFASDGAAEAVVGSGQIRCERVDELRAFRPRGET